MSEEERTIQTFKPSSWISINAWIIGIVGGIVGSIIFLQVLVLSSLYIKNITEISNIITQYGLFCSPILIGLIYAIWQTLIIKSVVYTITTQRIIRRKGILSRSYTEIELLRVRDFTIDEPFGLRILGLGNLCVYSAEQQNPSMTLGAQPNIVNLRDTLRRLVLKRQVQMGYREVGIGGSI